MGAVLCTLHLEVIDGSSVQPAPWSVQPCSVQDAAVRTAGNIEQKTVCLPGVHGRVTELAQATSKKYNIALAVLLAKDMDSVVVDSESVAKDCIKLLKDRKAPPMTFYPLPSIRVLRSCLLASCIRLLHPLKCFRPPHLDDSVPDLVKKTERSRISSNQAQLLTTDLNFYHPVAGQAGERAAAADWRDGETGAGHPGVRPRLRARPAVHLRVNFWPCP